jgi:hypothetical protein
MDLLVLDTAIPYKRMSTLKKHITDFGTFPHFILTCIKICFSLLLLKLGLYALKNEENMRIYMHAF